MSNPTGLKSIHNIAPGTFGEVVENLFTSAYWELYYWAGPYYLPNPPNGTAAYEHKVRIDAKWAAKEAALLKEKDM